MVLKLMNKLEERLMARVVKTFVNKVLPILLEKLRTKVLAK